MPRRIDAVAPMLNHERPPCYAAGSSGPPWTARSAPCWRPNGRRGEREEGAGMPQQRLHGLHVFPVRDQQGAECMPEHMPSKVFGDSRPLGRRSNVAFHQRIRPVRLAPFTSRAGEHPIFVLGVLGVRPPTQKVGDHSIVQRHQLAAGFSLRRAKMLVRAEARRLMPAARMLVMRDVSWTSGRTCQRDGSSATERWMPICTGVGFSFSRNQTFLPFLVCRSHLKNVN